MQIAEIEQTARLSPEEYYTLHSILKKNFKKEVSFKRFMIRFFKDKVNVRESVDIRYKWTSGKNELVIKKGALGTQKRQELTIPLIDNQLTNYITFFQLLGYSIGIAMFREVERYRNDVIEVSLVTAYPYHFVEVEALDGKSKTKALAAVRRFLTEQKLKVLNKSEYQAFARLCDREVNLTFKLSEFPNILTQHDFWKRILKQIGFIKR